jgi:hypothetical protein
LPAKLSSTQACQTQLPDLFGAVEEQLLRFELSANAASEREAMKARAILENPSSEIVRLQHEESTIQRQLTRCNIECEAMDEIIVQLIIGQEQYNAATRNLQEALAHKQQYDELRKHPIVMAKPMEILQGSHRHGSYAETWMPNGTKSVIVRMNKDRHKHLFLLDKHNRFLMTNFPCPNGCGFLVTWHDSHCCGACARGSGHHDQRCQRKPLHTQEDARAKMTRWKQDRIAHNNVLSAEDDASNRKFNQARKDAKSAERMGAQALTRIPFTIRERYPALCSSLRSENYLVANSPHGGCGCSQIGSIQQEIAMVKRSQSFLTEQLSAVEHLMTRSKDEAAEMEQKLTMIQSLEEQENTRIFNQLRTQVLGNESSSLPPPINPAFRDSMSSLPSAPTEEQVLASILESNELSHEFAVARQIEPVPAEASMIVSSPVSRQDCTIPMASATLLTCDNN